MIYHIKFESFCPIIPMPCSFNLRWCMEFYDKQITVGNISNIFQNYEHWWCSWKILVTSVFMVIKIMLYLWFILGKCLIEKKNIVLETWSELVLDPQQGTYPHWISHTFWSCFPFMLVAPNIYECLWDCYLYYRSFILISPDPPYKRIINKMAITMILP